MEDKEEPVKIVGIIAEDITEPRNDGSRGSALYAVPFRLSRSVSADWATVFEQVWSHPPRFTLMHRPGIARVSGDRIVLDGTTIEKVKDCHRDTLVLCIQETNRIIDEHEARVLEERRKRARMSEEHSRRVRSISDQIRFDD